MADDIKDAGALAGVVRYGVPWHGRIEGATLYTGKLDALGAEVTRAWLQPASSDCWRVQRPGLPDPYLDAPAAKTAAALEGKELTNYALLAGQGNIHGKGFSRSNDDKHRWLWVDDNGEVFSVVFGLVGGVAQHGLNLDYDGFTPRDWSFAAPVTARFKIQRYGELRTDGEPAPVVTVNLVLTAAEIGQDGPALTGLYAVDLGPYDISGGNMILRDLSAVGDQAIMEVHSNVFDTLLNRRIFGVAGARPFVSHRESSNPLGFVQFSLSGTGAAPSVSLSVLASRADALGVQSHTRPVYSLTSAWVCGDCSDFIDDPDMGVLCQYSCASHQIDQTVVEYSGRIVGYDFDAAGLPQPHVMTRRTQTDNDSNIAPTTFGAGGHTVSRSEQTTVTLTVGGQVHALDDAWQLSASASLAAAVCTGSRTDTYTSDSGISGTNYTTTGGFDCDSIVWEGYDLSESACGTACKTPAAFSPYSAARMHAEAFVMPTAIAQYTRPSGLLRLGSNLYGVLWGAFSDPRMGAVCVISQHQKAVGYTVWNADRSSLSRFYGARNPATGEIAFPHAGPVNFA